MRKLRRISVAGFRGALAETVLELIGGDGRPTSAVIYGRNGTGKSTITDAWEWIASGSIGHLSREGAGPSSYPHMGATPGQTWAEIELDHAEVGVARLDFDPAHPARPRVIGNIQPLRAHILHPCHLRHGDLTRFVYLTKSERHDELAKLMGFGKQVEFQKSLRRALKAHRERCAALSNELNGLTLHLKQLLGDGEPSDARVASVIQERALAHGVECDTSEASQAEAAVRLRRLVESDPTSAELASLGRLDQAFALAEIGGGLVERLGRYATSAVAFRENEDEFKRLLMVDVYEAGLVAVDAYGDSICPLCGQGVDGSLRDHVKHELAGLSALKDSYAAAEAAREQSIDANREVVTQLQALRQAIGLGTTGIQDTAVQQLCSAVDLAIDCGAQLAGASAESPAQLDASGLGELRARSKECESAVHQLNERLQRLRVAVAGRREELASNTARASLVRDDNVVAQLRSVLPGWNATTARAVKCEELATKLSRAADAYGTASASAISERFGMISSEVAEIFETLESETHGIRQPVLRMHADQERAVMLEVEFHGTIVSPAHKYLSESQLNSFGVAVFLASVKQFNPELSVVILDDVINSMDAEKRPLLLDVLAGRFAQHQVILLTHDEVWRDAIYRRFPNWRRHELRKWTIGRGVALVDGRERVDDIEGRIADDRPSDAGALLGPLIERRLREACEFLEAEVKFRRRNDQSMDELLVRLRVRAEDKLGSHHGLVQDLRTLESESGFRNLCAHDRDANVPLTQGEMQRVVNAWKTIVGHLECSACRQGLRWREPRFLCPCGATEMRRASSLA